MKKKTKAQKIISREMEHFEKKELHSGKNGKIVTNPKQAIAISLQMARKAGAKIPKKKSK